MAISDAWNYAIPVAENTLRTVENYSSPFLAPWSATAKLLTRDFAHLFPLPVYKFCVLQNAHYTTNTIVSPSNALLRRLK